MKQPSPRTLSSSSKFSLSRSPSGSSYYKILFALFSCLPKLAHAVPLPAPLGMAFHAVAHSADGASAKEAPLTESEFYTYMIASIALVVLGGVFAGLTLGLMGQDEVYLKVLAESGSPNEKKCSKEVLALIGRGKHWLLVTLLLSNVITNETLPVILDRFLGGGFVAVFSSTVSIVIFGEIIPQSVCVRYGLQLGAYFSPFVLCLMYLMYPVAYPIAKLLDYILGQDHGTVYRKSGLKTLVTLHKTMGVERLNEDEVTIISSVLDLKAKPVSDIMTPMEKVYTMSSDKILDEAAVEEIFNAGFSRIPIHLPNEPTNFVGMLLVRILISYDPEDALPVSSFPLATLPETGLDTSCLNILNYFQEGKSHMVIVSRTPGLDSGAQGVLTLEDVIEELIGEEIIDESDVYIDLSKNVKRTNPGPLAKRNISNYLQSLYSINSSTKGLLTPSRASIDMSHVINSENAAAAANGHSDTHTSPSLDRSESADDLEHHPHPNGVNFPSYYNKRTSIDSQLQQFQNSRGNSMDVSRNPTTASGLADSPEESRHGQINATTLNGMKPSNLAVNPLQTSNTHVTIKKQPILTSNKNGNTTTVTATPVIETANRDLNASPSRIPQNSSISNEPINRADTPDYGAVHATEAGAFVNGIKQNIERMVQNGEIDGNSNHSEMIKQFLLPTDKKGNDEVDLSESFARSSSGIPLPRSEGLIGSTNSTSNVNNLLHGQGANPLVGKFDGNNGLTPTSSTIGVKSKRSASLRSESVSLDPSAAVGININPSINNSNVAFEQQSVKTGGLVENIISIRGVNKTVIESALSDTEGDNSNYNSNSDENANDTDVEETNYLMIQNNKSSRPGSSKSNGSNGHKKERRDSKRIWNWS